MPDFATKDYVQNILKNNLETFVLRKMLKHFIGWKICPKRKKEEKRKLFNFKV